jgi:hypothetical protein
MFSELRDMAAAKAFFESAKMVTGVMPDRVTTGWVSERCHPRGIPDPPGPAKSAAAQLDCAPANASAVPLTTGMLGPGVSDASGMRQNFLSA